MNRTKQKILRATRLLFNEYGVALISQRKIASHIAISPGNLTYHFKKRDDIIETLYFELAAEIRESIDEVSTLESSITALLTLTKSINKTLFNYRFFSIDFIQIVRSNQKIGKDYTEISTKREKWIETTIKTFVKNGIMRKAELPYEYEHLYKRIQITNDFWIASVGTTTEDIMLKHTRSYTETIIQAIYPYLTEKGKKEYLKAVKNWES